MRALFRQNKHLLFFLLAANLLQTFGHSVWRALFNNCCCLSCAGLQGNAHYGR